MEMIETKALSKTFSLPSGDTKALSAVDLSIDTGEFVAIVGRSGSGKTTLLNLLAGIDRPSSGEIHMAGARIDIMRNAELAAFRGRNIGLVFQFFQLLPTLTVLENVMLPMDFCDAFPSRERAHRARSLLADMGIADQANKLPSLLSGGQQQRAAIARALANDPPILLADEPTGNLDSQTSDTILRLFQRLSRQGKTVVMVTHERNVFTYVSRQITLVDGRQVASEIPSVAGGPEAIVTL
jgi:putative ABC transport system ATP-binding protein